jgi:hypothetical protein
VGCVLLPKVGWSGTGRDPFEKFWLLWRHVDLVERSCRDLDSEGRVGEEEGETEREDGRELGMRAKNTGLLFHSDAVRVSSKGCHT